MMMRKFPALPNIALPFVDIRDFSKAHYQALVEPQAAGNRYNLNSCSMNFIGIAKTLKEEFGPLGYKVPSSVVPRFLVKIASWFSPTAKYLLNNLGKVPNCPNDKIKNELGMTFYDPETTIKDMGYSLIDMGLVADKRKPKK
jgi:dihydroflavonol-4-reductase